MTSRSIGAFLHIECKVAQTSMEQDACCVLPLGGVKIELIVPAFPRGCDDG